MPKLLFTPKFHTIGDQPDIFVTASQPNDLVICIKCNEDARFILEQMYPDYKPTSEIIAEVMAHFAVSEREATEAVNLVLTKLRNKGDVPNES